MLVHEDRIGHCLVQMFLIFILVKSATVKQSNDVESCGFAAPRCVDLNCVCSPCLNLKQLKVPRDGASLGYWARLPWPGCLSWRKRPARTKQFRILLLFKLEHIEGLLSDW